MHDRGMYRYIMMYNKEALRNGTPRILPKREAILKGIQGPQGNEEGPCPCEAKNFQGLCDGYLALLRHLGLEEWNHL